ncbi:MAG: 16S rRNA (cytosine(1402)-N(4))-methyltransferase RsmH [Ruminococcaceae bacterium]|nr:16S rRNA (cytosine(1402)-N(4))-methyltransferase RsmH [Oscillospiraceae bacterium]
MFVHVPVMLEPCIDALNIRPDGIYVDGTMGGAGHSSEIAKRLVNGRLVAIDQDSDAIAAGGERLSAYGERAIVVEDNFKNMKNVLSSLGIRGVDGILMDLGVSSYQLDCGERGFSYNIDAPLDMRMSRKQKLSAYDVVNTYSEQDLADVIYNYGEERFSRRIAANIVKKRSVDPIETTLELAEIIKASIPASNRREGPHPAKRTFQAIRIEVNNELGMLHDAVSDAVDMLNKGGRIAIITFHSLEDRIVKTVFAEKAKGCVCPPEFPICVCGHQPQVKLITRKPIEADERELEINPRARSAKLRVAEKL